MYKFTCLDCSPFAKHFIKLDLQNTEDSYRVILKNQHMVLIFRTLVIHMINFSTLWKINVTENYTDTCTKKKRVCTKIKCIIGHIKLNFTHKVCFSELIL